MKIRHRRRHLKCLVFYWIENGIECSRVYLNDIGRKGWGLRHENRMAWYRANR